ncbi:hypothetical protein [Streptomyces sp. NPDC058741]|uniref:hypothetical protein n=1 Tax=Streptomyces sp. NPDC058741 TaxID=3346620 RepID=UPI0036BAE743
MSTLGRAFRGSVEEPVGRVRGESDVVEEARRRLPDPRRRVQPEAARAVDRPEETVLLSGDPLGGRCRRVPQVRHALGVDLGAQFGGALSRPVDDGIPVGPDQAFHRSVPFLRRQLLVLADGEDADQVVDAVAAA